MPIRRVIIRFASSLSQFTQNYFTEWRWNSYE